MQIDSASWLDPLVFSTGFCFATAGLTLTQFFLDDYLGGSPQGYQRFVRPLVFFMIRKITVFALLLGVVLGFWIVGWWWTAIGALVALIAAVAVNIINVWNRSLGPVYFLCFVGLSMMTWAQSPVLKQWGVLP